MNTEYRQRKKPSIIKTLLITVGILFIAFICITFILETITDPYDHVKPSYPKADITPLLNEIESRDINSFEGEMISSEEYTFLYEQSGLSYLAIDDIMEQGDWKKTILNMQKNLFEDAEVVDNRLLIFTSEERISDINGNPRDGFEFVPLKDGDILITRGTHTFGYRHGHIALVVDAGKSKVIESAAMFNNSGINNLNLWNKYANVMVLRPKISEAELIEIVKTAKDMAVEIPYRLLSSTNTNDSLETGLSGSQCAHLIWWPFYMYGYDLNSDGSWLVTPKDISQSPLLEVVQVYGFDPVDLW